MATSTKLVQGPDLDVEVDTSPDGQTLISAWARNGGRLAEPIFLNVPGEQLSAIVDLVTRALAPDVAESWTALACVKCSTVFEPVGAAHAHEGLCPQCITREHEARQVGVAHG